MMQLYFAFHSSDLSFPTTAQQNHEVMRRRHTSGGDGDGRGTGGKLGAGCGVVGDGSCREAQHSQQVFGNPCS